MKPRRVLDASSCGVELRSQNRQRVQVLPEGPHPHQCGSKASTFPASAGSPSCRRRRCRAPLPLRHHPRSHCPPVRPRRRRRRVSHERASGAMPCCQQCTRMRVVVIGAFERGPATPARAGMEESDLLLACFRSGNRSMFDCLDFYDTRSMALGRYGPTTGPVQKENLNSIRWLNQYHSWCFYDSRS